MARTPALQAGGRGFESRILVGSSIGRTTDFRSVKWGSIPQPTTKIKRFEIMIRHDLKTIVKSPARLDCVKAGGVAVYHITTEDRTVYQLDIDLSDKHDVGETATFMSSYDKSVILMRWIRRAIENDELYIISK